MLNNYELQYRQTGSLKKITIKNKIKNKYLFL